MPRVKLQEQLDYEFRHDVTVRVTDINYGGHLGNDTVLTLIHEARFRFLKSLGYKNEIDLEHDTGLIVADSVVVYRAEAFHGDSLDIHLGVYDHNAYGFDMFYYLVNKETGKEIARAKTGIVCLNYKKKKITKTPEEFIRRLRELEPYTI